jgi:hypothetical protein
MLFNFQMREVEEVAKSLADHERISNLGWFLLSDGWYWMEIGDREALRYHDDILALWEAEGEPRELPYVDWYVTTLHETVLEVLPHALNPLSPELARRLGTVEEWNKWKDKAWEWLDSRPDDEYDAADDLYGQAIGWQHGLMPDTVYIPDISFWRVNDTFHIWWSCDRAVDNIPLWACDSGEASMPVADFLNEVTSFHERFRRKMAPRIEAAPKLAESAGLDINVDWLHKVYEMRIAALDKALAQVPEPGATDWSIVLDAIKKIETDESFKSFR